MTTTNYGKVAVLMGGVSAEREISLRSGQAVLTALQNVGIDAVGLDIQSDAVAQLQACAPDRVFIALHGRGGEDGTMQGLLDLMGLPYTGSRVLGSALGMDKFRCKQIWQAQGLPVPPGQLLNAASDFSAVAAQLGLPLMVKPVNEGSSVGMSRVESAAELAEAWQVAAKYDAAVLAERYIQGGEYTVSILDDRALPVIKLETPRAFYDYQAKYQDNQTRYLCPCGLPAAQEQAMQALALEAFRAMAASGWGRVDIMLDDDGAPWLLEVNTVPGMTDHSLVPMAAKAAGIEFSELVLAILDTSLLPSG